MGTTLFELYNNIEKDHGQSDDLEMEKDILEQVAKTIIGDELYDDLNDEGIRKRLEKVEIDMQSISSILDDEANSLLYNILPKLKKELKKEAATRILSKIKEEQENENN